jgi:ABC-2 type transport system ATP-binding protein
LIEGASAVELRGVGKSYGRREQWALRGVDLSFARGEVVGFIGPNGAGKTTLIKLLSGLSRASEGEVWVLGQDLTKRAVSPDGIGLVVEHPAFIPYLSGRKNLELLAGIRKVAGAEDITESLRAVGLDPGDRRPTRAYSLGMRQRLGLAQALMEKPRLLLLDEPTNGLDPQGIIELRGLIRRLAEEGAAVFLASHLLAEVEQVCDRVLLVRDGRVVKELDRRQTETPTLRLVVSGEADLAPLLEWARESGTGIEPVGGSPLSVHLTVDRPTPQVVRELVGMGVNVEEISQVQRSLEQEFLDLVGSPAR